MKLTYLSLLFCLLVTACDKEEMQTLAMEDDHTESSVLQCTTSWDLSCLSAGDSATFSVDALAGHSATWAITANEAETFSIIDSSQAFSVTVKANTTGRALLNVAVMGNNFFCAYCEDICAD